MNNFICLLTLFSLSYLIQSCNQNQKDEIIILNLDDPCLDGFLISHVENKIKIIQENSSCEEIKNWKIQNGSISYLGNCEFLIIPNLQKPLESFHLTNEKDSLEFLILLPIIKQICIDNFGCSHNNPKKKLKIRITTDHIDLNFSEIKYDYEFYKSAKLLSKGKSDSFEIPWDQREVDIQFQKDYYFLLKNIYLKSEQGLKMKIDTVRNYYAGSIFH
ncbi:MAG: hypothetical protein AB8F94_10360 [Saprospiraceae bacterium]